MKQTTRNSRCCCWPRLALTGTAAQAGSLKDIGNAAAYPFKKGAHNAGKTAVEGAGQASKSLNHAGQAVRYSVRKTGENASKTAHKAVQEIEEESRPCRNEQGLLLVDDRPVRIATRIASSSYTRHGEIVTLSVPLSSLSVSAERS